MNCLKNMCIKEIIIITISEKLQKRNIVTNKK